LIPAELSASTLKLPPSERCSIVVITGTELRHDRFALRLQAEFPDLVVAWLQIVRPFPTSSPTKTFSDVTTNKIRAVFSKVRTTPTRTLLSIGTNRIVARFEPRALSQREVEDRLFGDEIRQLRNHCHLKATMMHDPNAAQTIAFVKSLEPYFLLTLGGAIYGSALCDCARGLALTQHDGWCPEYRGPDPVDWALYHRDLAKVGSTVQVLTDSMNSGPILRRSIACLAVDDTPESCFARSVALGTELMCETVRDLIQTKQARTFPQPQFTGSTHLSRHMTADIKTDVRHMLNGGFIRDDIARRQTF
jgi:hypothetical protein